MNGVVLLAASLAALAAFLIVRGLVGAPMRLATRIGPYTGRVRQRLGTVIPVTPAGARSVWAALFTSLADAVGAVADAGQTAKLDQRLRHAGMGHLSVEDYRRRQLATTAAGGFAGLVIAALLRLSVGASLGVVVACAFFGLTRWRAVLDRRSEQRRAVIQAEAHVVCQMLAIYLRTGDTPMGAVERLTGRADGIVPAELAGAASVIRSGSPPVEVLEQLAADTADRSAARLYRLYGATWQASGDPTALMALAEVLRATRREELSRRMAKRRTAMVLPLVMIIGPILILFIAAAIPSIVLGR